MPGRRRGRLAGSRAGGRSRLPASKGGAARSSACQALSLDKQASRGLPAVTDWGRGSGRLGGCQRGVTVGEIGGSGGGGYVAGKQQ